jgi:hypothetical protein
MGLLRGIDPPSRGTPAAPGVAYEQELRTLRSTRLAAGTLACGRCDAPIAIGGEVLALGDELTCPFCHNRGPARDFLSLALPTRAAHVVVRVSRPARLR